MQRAARTIGFRNSRGSLGPSQGQSQRGLPRLVAGSVFINREVIGHRHLQRQIEAEARNASSICKAVASQVEVSERNVQVTKETLELTRQKFAAGVTDNVAVVQAQASLASADLDYINSVFAHNLANSAWPIRCPRRDISRIVVIPTGQLLQQGKNEE